MELVDLPKPKPEELTEKQSANMFEAIVRGKDVVEEIETSRGKFKIKFPRMRDVEAIGKLTAMRLGGMSATSFDAGIYSIFQMIATLDICVVSGPSWYENAKKEESFGWGNMPTQDFIQEVYEKVLEFRADVQKQLKPGKKNTGDEVAAAQSDDGNADMGLFEGVSS